MDGGIIYKVPNTILRAHVLLCTIIESRVLCCYIKIC